MRVAANCIEEDASMCVDASDPRLRCRIAATGHYVSSNGVVGT